MHSSSTFSIPVVVPRGTVFPCNGRRPRGRGGRVGRVWRTTVVNRTHSVNSYVAVQAGVCLRCRGPVRATCVPRLWLYLWSLPVRTSGTCVTVTGTYATVTYGILRSAALCASVGPRGSGG